MNEQKTASILQLNQIIDQFLSKKSNLSKSYLAKKCGITLAYLTMILSGKRNLTADLSVKLLELINETPRDIQTFLKQLDKEQQSNAVKAFKEKTQEKRQAVALNEEVTRILAHNSKLYHAVLDLTWGPMHKDYFQGKYGKDLAAAMSILIDKKFIHFDGIAYRLLGGNDLASNAEHVFRMVRNLLENEEANYILKEHPGSVRYQVDDISEAGYEKIRHLMNDTLKKVDEIVETHRESPISGKGIRMGFVGLITRLRRA